MEVPVTSPTSIHVPEACDHWAAMAVPFLRNICTMPSRLPR